MESLPYEVLENIFSYLPLVDQKSVKLTCRRLYLALNRPIFISSQHYILRNGFENFKFLFAEEAVDTPEDCNFGKANPYSESCYLNETLNLQVSGSNVQIPVPNLPRNLSSWGKFVTSFSVAGQIINCLHLTAILSLCLNLSFLDISGCNSLFDVHRHTGSLKQCFLEDEDDRNSLRCSVGASLRRISLANITSLRNENVKHILQSFPCVRDFNFSGCFMDSTISLGECGKVNSICGVQLSFRCFLSFLSEMYGHFDGAPLLLVLRLNSTGITDRDLELLCSSSFIRLSGLWIENCRNLTDRGLTALLSSVRSMTFLRELYMGLPSADVNFTSLLPHLKIVGPQLKRLGLSKLPITSKTELATLLTHCSSVEHLDVSSCCLRFTGWSEYLWLNLHCISSLDLSGHFHLTDEDISVMTLSLRNRLKFLNIGSCMKLTDSSLNSICSNLSSSLEVLIANWCKGFSDIGFRGADSDLAFATGLYSCPRLKEVNLSDCHQITSHSFLFSSESYIPPFQNLLHLYLGRIGPFMGESLINLSKCAPFLESLDISRSSVDDYSLNIVTVKLQRTLRKLYLSGCEEITDSTLKHLAANVPYLRVLDVSFCPHVSAEALQMFKSSMPFLSELKALYIGTAVLKIKHARQRSAEISFL